MSNEGQVSESSMMSPQGGADTTPGTDDGIPAAADTQHASQGGRVDYDDEGGDEPTQGN